MKLLIIDDHALVRDALRAVLRELDAEADVLEASDWQQASRQIDKTPDLDLVLLDLGLPDRDGFEVLEELRETRPAISIVVLSGRDDQASVAKALDSGAIGFIPKSASREVMLSAFNLVFSGGMYIPPELLGRQEAAPSGQSPGWQPSPPGRPSKAALGLTERQRDVLALLMQGKSNKAICRVLDLAEPTVKNHVTAIMRVLKATNRTEAVVAAHALGFDPRPSTK